MEKTIFAMEDMDSPWADVELRLSVQDPLLT
jgi:hypothetical protein